MRRRQFVATTRPATIERFRRHAKDKDTLDSECVLHRLAKTCEYTTLARYAKHVDGKVGTAVEAAGEKAEEELRRKLEVHRWHMRLELKGLIAKCERIRSEHRGQWEDGLAKLVLAQKNKIADVRGARAPRAHTLIEPSKTLARFVWLLTLATLAAVCAARHARETKKAGEAIRASLEPSVRPVQRVDMRQNLSLLSPRRKPSASIRPASHQGHSPRTILSPPTQRPSRVAMTSRGSSLHTAPFIPNATSPPRPYTSEHVPRRDAHGGRGPPNSAR